MVTPNSFYSLESQSKTFGGHPREDPPVPQNARSRRESEVTRDPHRDRLLCETNGLASGGRPRLQHDRRRVARSGAVRPTQFYLVAWVQRHEQGRERRRGVDALAVE